MDTGYIINVQGYIDTSTAIIEQVNYYDTYRFLSGSYAEEFAKISATSSTNGVGRLTGTISAASNGQNVFRVNYYDVKGNITKVLEKGLDDHVCHTVNGYTFTNQLDSTYTSVDVGYGEPFRVRNSYTYNIHNNMPESLSVSLSHGDSYHTNTISYEYDDLNRLVRTVRPEGVGDIAYSYDLHGWLTDIESNSFKESLFYADGFGRPCYNGNISSMQWQNSTYDRQRGYKFYYDKLNRLTSAIYDEDTSGSNIQGLIKGEKVTANKTNELSALRSKFERIATSVQPYEAEPLLEAIAEIDEDCQECVMEEDSLQLQDFEATENLNNNIACYDEYVEYDLNGNITHLQRYGRMQDDTFGTIDNLHVSLNGNQLSSVTDEAARVVSEGAIDFNNADDGQSEYTYNACGSLTSDTGRGIAMIEYDNCNNPMRIQFTSGNVTKYVYTADGQKLRTIYYTAMPNITVPIGETKVLAPAEILCVDSVDYMLGGSLILRNGRMDKYLFDEGYCQAKEPFCCIAKPVMFTGFFDEEKGEFISSVPTEEERKIYQELCERWGKAMEAIRNSDEFTFYYYNKDHLGNIREVVNDVGQISQVTNYYPFGSPYCDTQSTINPELQPFKYNGKELDMMHGLNAYDYGARQYYSPLPVWDRVDPLAEKYYNVSPYAYCHNNPVNRIDPDGMDDYYTYTGQFLRSDNKETDYIKIGWSIEVGFPEENVTVNGGIPIEEMNLSAEAYSNIFTDVLSKMEDVDINEISNGKISIIKWDYQSNPHENLFSYEVQDSYNATNGSIGNISDIRKDDNKQTITAYIYPQGTAERKLYNSVSNVQNLLGVHEYLGHYKNGLTHNYTQHDPTFLFQQKHKSWRKTTQQFKNYEHSIYNK